MTKEITKANILQEIQDKFKLREFAPGNFLFEETVIPIYDIEPHLQNWEIEQATVSVTAATAFKFLTVPDDEEWVLRAYQVIFMTGTYKVSGAYLKVRPLTADYIYLDLKLNQSVSYLVNLPQMVKLHSGTEIWIYVDDYTATGDLRIVCDTRREIIR